MAGGPPPFALPVPGYRQGIHTRNKRRRQTTTEEQDDDGDEEALASTTPSAPGTPHSHLPADAINPRSHSPDTLRQLAVAGLAPEAEVPSRSFPLFPHKPLPAAAADLVSARGRGGRRRRRGGVAAAAGESSSGGGGGGAGTDTDAGEDAAAVVVTTVKQHSARLKHLGTVTAILHRCLAEGDVARAKRAFGLLVQTKEVDVRVNHLWAVGSEILMRDGEGTTADGARPRQQQRDSGTRQPGDASVIDDGITDEDREMEGGEAHNDGSSDSGSSSDGDGDGDGDSKKRQSSSPPPRRWGSAANLEAVRTYFENLIQQHPHDPHRPHLTSALDFWPVLFGVEIYNVDAEFRRALHQLRIATAAEEEEEENEEARNVDDGSGFGFGFGFGADAGEQGYDEYMGEAHRQQQQQQRDGERRGLGWAARDELRHETSEAALRVAARMDAAMENAPCAKHPELLRLRGMLALFLGDLQLPARLIESAARARARASRQRRGGGKSALAAADALLARLASGPEERAALARRREEQERARGFFARIVENGGVLDGWVKSFVEEEEDEDGSAAGSGEEDTSY